MLMVLFLWLQTIIPRNGVRAWSSASESEYWEQEYNEPMNAETYNDYDSSIAAPHIEEFQYHIAGLSQPVDAMPHLRKRQQVTQSTQRLTAESESNSPLSMVSTRLADNTSVPTVNDTEGNETCQASLNKTYDKLPYFQAYAPRRKAILFALAVTSLIALISTIPSMTKVVSSSRCMAFDNLMLSTLISMFLSSGILLFYGFLAAPLTYTMDEKEKILQGTFNGTLVTYEVKQENWCVVLMIVLYSCRHVQMLSLLSLSFVCIFMEKENCVHKFCRGAAGSVSLVVMIWVVVSAVVSYILIPNPYSVAINKNRFACYKCELDLAYLTTVTTHLERGLVGLQIFMTTFLLYMATRLNETQRPRIKKLLYLYIFLVMCQVPSIVSSYFFQEYLDNHSTMKDVARYDLGFLALRIIQGVCWTVTQFGTFIYQLLLLYCFDTLWCRVKKDPEPEKKNQLNKQLPRSQKNNKVNKWVKSLDAIEFCRVKSESIHSEYTEQSLTKSLLRMFWQPTNSISNKSSNAILLDKVVRLGFPLPKQDSATVSLSRLEPTSVSATSKLQKPQDSTKMTPSGTSTKPRPLGKQETSRQYMRPPSSSDDTEQHEQFLRDIKTFEQADRTSFVSELTASTRLENLDSQSKRSMYFDAPTAVTSHTSAIAVKPQPKLKRGVGHNKTAEHASLNALGILLSTSKETISSE